MSSRCALVADRSLTSFDRSPVDQVLENLRQALRVLDLVPSAQTELTPHPLVIVRAEIENARRYLANVKLVEFENQQQALRKVA